VKAVGRTCEPRLDQTGPPVGKSAQ